MKSSKDSVCGNRSILEKILLVVILLLLGFVLALFIVLVLQYGRLFKIETTTCSTSECIKAAAEIVDLVDFSVDPCDNFNDFVCGKERFVIIEENINAAKLKTSIQHQVDALITQSTAEFLPEPLQLQRRFYRSCMDTTAIDEDGHNTFLNLIQEIGGWPLYQGRFWNRNHFHWLTSMTELRKLGFKYQFFFSFTTVEDEDTGLIILAIDPPLVNSELLKDTDASYLSLMKSVALYLGAPEHLPEEEFNRVYEFEKKLNKLVQANQNVTEELILSVSEMQSKFSFISWAQFLNDITNSKVEFDLNTTVSLSCEKYVEELIQLMAETPPRIQSNYLIWKLIESQVQFLNSSIRMEFFNYDVAKNPLLIQERPEEKRMRFCLNHSTLYFPLVAETFYSQKVVTNETKSNVMEMVARIKSQTLKFLNSTSTDPDVYQKLAMMTVNVGYPNKDMDDFYKVLETKKFHLMTDNIIEMVNQLSKIREDHYFSMVNTNISQPSEVELNQSQILDSKPSYFPNSNILFLPASLLLGVTYNFKRPNYMNYAALGSLIANEMILAVTGANGTFNENMEECKGNATGLSEPNFQRIVFNLAYLSYEEFIKEHGEERNLPGFNKYHTKQMFWVTLGAFECYRFHPNSANLEDVKASSFFSSDFHCLSNSNINMIQKCQN